MLRRVFRKIETLAARVRLRLIWQLTGIEGVSNAIRYLGHPTQALRRWGATIGKGSLVYPGIVIHAAQKDYSNLRIGNDVRIVRDCVVDLTDCITIEDSAIVSLRCCLITHRNIHLSPLKDFGFAPMQAPITIRRGAVLFANSVVLAGVTIGECAVVAAGAVVTKDVPPWTLVGGVPARSIRRLDRQVGVEEENVPAEAA